MITNELRELFARLRALLDTDPAEAVRQARLINPTQSNQVNVILFRAEILVDGGAAAHQRDACEEGVKLFREIYHSHPISMVAYNLANGLVAIVERPSGGSDWLDHQERTRDERAEARRLYWRAAQDLTADPKLRTQAWTNLANQFTNSYRLSEAHDGRLAALAIDPENGVAAGCAARDLLWLFNQIGCSDLTRIEAIKMAKIAKRHQDRTREYAGELAAKELAALADELGDAPLRSPHSDPFIQWVEQERLTLAPVVELVDPALGKLDWLMLPGIMEREPDSKTITPPPVFAMFNVLKADFILARDLAWRANKGTWPATGRFADTLDYATYGPEASALVLAHRTALDLLDKVAVTANHYFQIGQPSNKVYFGKLWRGSLQKSTGLGPLLEPVEAAIRRGAEALYGLVELAEDYESEDGILRAQKDLRNAGTHRFVVLHDFGDQTACRQAPEVEHHRQEQFAQEVLRALRVARSAIQMLTLAITQHEKSLTHQTNGFVGRIRVFDHDWTGECENGAACAKHQPRDSKTRENP